MDANERDDNGTWSSGRVMFGLVLISLGALMMLDRLRLLDFRLSGHYWPFFPILFGLARFLNPGYRRGVPCSRRSGAWLMYVGFWSLVNEFHLFGLWWDTSWPLMIIGGGAMMIWKAIEGPQPRRVREN